METVERAGSRVRQDKSQRLAQILDAAELIIGERGYYGFGIQELAERCGLTKPGLLHHISSKDELLIALLRNRDERHRAAVLALLGGDTGVEPTTRRVRFVAALRSILEQELRQPELIRLQVVLRTETINEAHPAHAHFTAREAEKQHIFAQALAGFVEQPQSATRRILCFLHGLQEQWLRDGGGFDFMVEYDSAIALLLPAIEGRTTRL